MNLAVLGSLDWGWFQNETGDGAVVVVAVYFRHAKQGMGRLMHDLSDMQLQEAEEALERLEKESEESFWTGFAAL